VRGAVPFVLSLLASLAAPVSAGASGSGGFLDAGLFLQVREGLSGWSELDVRIEHSGGYLEVDTGHFCGLPCSLLLAPGEHTFHLGAPGEETQTLVRTFEPDRSLLLEGDLIDSGTDGWGVALYAVGAALLLTAVALVSYDVAVNVGEGGDDWTLSYVAAGLGPVGIALAIWGSVRRRSARSGFVESVVPPAP
jgi:hypothetical protein